MAEEAFRRSELVALDVADCGFNKDGLTVTLHRSKTDQCVRGFSDRFGREEDLRNADIAMSKLARQ